MMFTGFESWGDITYNPSWDVAKSAAQVFGGESQLLAVIFDKEDWVFDGPAVHFGLAVGRKGIELERYAHNLRKRNHLSEPLVEGSPLAYQSAFNLDLMIDELKPLLVNWECKESRDAGTFVCNALYYSSLGQNRERLFVHIPMMDSSEAEEIGKVFGDYFLRKQNASD